MSPRSLVASGVAPRGERLRPEPGTQLAHPTRPEHEQDNTRSSEQKHELVSTHDCTPESDKRTM